MPSTPEPSLEAPADPLPAPAASGDGAKAEPEEGSEPAEVTESIPAPEDFVRVADWIPDIIHRPALRRRQQLHRTGHL